MGTFGIVLKVVSLVLAIVQVFIASKEKNKGNDAAAAYYMASAAFFMVCASN